MDLKSSKTYENLTNAFNAESRVYMLYSLMADCARKSYHHNAGDVFDQTARNEMAHAKLWHELLNPDCPDTVTSLNSSADGEHFEWTHMYNLYAETARSEGFPHIADLFDMVASIERAHEDRYRATSNAILSGDSHHTPQPVVWVCQNCGYRITAPDSPAICPVCSHDQSYFKRQG